jgi:tRNA threonylcarbamoyladenosine biosynthesis protein TsaB
MQILTIRTDKPDAEIGLFNNDQKLDYQTWTAHRILAETLNKKVDELLVQNNKTIKELDGILVYEGPGSFTGLRIGITVANAMAYGLNIPVFSSSDPDWISTGIKALLNGNNSKIVTPKYGAEPHITIQKR